MLPQKTLGYALISIGLLLIVLLALVKSNFDAQSVLLCEAVEADPDRSMEDCPAHTSTTPWLLMVGFGASVLPIAAGAYILLSQTRERPKKRMPLDEDEQELYDILRGSSGSVYQSDLVKATGKSKVKITRTLDKLEQKGLVERKRRGMTNLVILK